MKSCYMLKVLMWIMVFGMMNGCQFKELPIKHAELDRAIVEIADLYQLRLSLAIDAVALFKKYSPKEKAQTSYFEKTLDAVNKESFDRSMSSMLQLREFEENQNRFGRMVKQMLYQGSKNPRLLKDAEFVTTAAKLIEIDQSIDALKVAINEKTFAFNRMVSVPPESWANEIFYHYKIKHLWAIDGERSVAQQRQE